jgi:hypothetical protein
MLLLWGLQLLSCASHKLAVLPQLLGCNHPAAHQAPATAPPAAPVHMCLIIIIIMLPIKP